MGQQKMTDEEYEFMLEDRIAKIQAINEQYDLLNNSYIAFSGGKDSCVLSKLIDLALPGNNIPRVFANTGIEFNDMLKFVERERERDGRIIILNQKKNIIKTLKEYGYPFKSKPFSHNYCIFQNLGEKSKTYNAMKDSTRFGIPKKLKYMFGNKDVMPFKISEQCCYKLKKEISNKWKKDNKKTINITGLRQEEGGTRGNINCVVFDKEKELQKFHPLAPITDEWEEEFVKQNNIELCKLYYEPYNFRRTGCKGCPYTKDMQEQLNTMFKLLPNEYYQCLHLWKPVYDEYIRIGFRLKYYPHERGVQMNLFDLEEEAQDGSNKYI